MGRVRNLIVISGAQLAAVTMSRRTFWIVLGSLTPIVIVAGALGVLPLWRTTPAQALALTCLFTSLVTIGVVLLAEPGQGPAGWAMMTSALLLLISWANEWRVGPLPLASKVLGDLWIPVGGWALYRYPHQRLNRGDRWMFRLIFAWFLATSWLLVFLSLPEWHDFPPGWWPALFPDRHLYLTITRLVDVATVGLAVLYIVSWILRLQRASTAERTLKKPTGMAAIIAVGVGTCIPIAHALGTTGATLDVVFIVGTGALLAIPVAFLTAVLARYLHRTALVSMLPRVASQASTAEISAALRESLNDPGLQVLYWSDTERSYLDHEGLPAPDPRRDTHNLTVELRTTDNAPLAVIVADAAVGVDPDFLGAAAAAVAQSMENATLLETVRSQLSELQQATSRAMEAGLAERTRIQRDLHDGVQGQLAALALRLGAAIGQTGDPRTKDHLRDIRGELITAVADIRRLARGIRPAALDLELTAAIRGACDRLHLDASVEVSADELTDNVRETIYLAVSEAITNIAKHAHAHTVEVHVTRSRDEVLVVVSDDGIGGATQGSGTGLRSIRDRVSALNGQVLVSSPAGAGTRIEMRIPCAS